MKVKATARVKVTLELTVGTWGDNCGLDMVYRQAAEDAVQRLAKFAAANGCRIVGEPQVTAILTDAESSQG